MNSISLSLALNIYIMFLMLFTTCENVLNDLWFGDQIVPICLYNAILITDSMDSLLGVGWGGVGRKPKPSEYVHLVSSS